MELLQKFMGTSVTAGTMTTYRRDWKTWVEFVREKTQGLELDPYMRNQDDRVKILMVCHLLAKRKGEGKREKAAAAITAGIRKHFATAMCSTEWMDADAIAVARKACQRTPAENRSYIREGRGRARLPVWFSLLERLREQLWEGRGYGHQDIDAKMTYITAMFGFDLAARASEAADPGGESEEHTILCEDITIHLKEAIAVGNQVTARVRGGDSTALALIEVSNVLTLEVSALTHKVGQINTSKRITREGEEQEQFLEDMVEFMKNSGATVGNPLFSRTVEQANGRRTTKRCRPEMITKAIKAEVVRQGLCPDLFSFHSLRKGTITHMKAMRVERAQILARGNYSEKSVMTETVYNYDSSGIGPLGAMAGKSGKQPTKEDIARAIPLAYHTKDKTNTGELRSGETVSGVGGKR
jgi:hypothetical protein